MILLVIISEPATGLLVSYFWQPLDQRQWIWNNLLSLCSIRRIEWKVRGAQRLTNSCDITAKTGLDMFCMLLLGLLVTLFKHKCPWYWKFTILKVTIEIDVSFEEILKNIRIHCATLRNTLKLPASYVTSQY